MSPTDLAVQEQKATAGKRRVVNDFSLQIATVNGSGSQTANMVLLRSIPADGRAVSGKNMFPSNTAGLPTCTRFARASAATSGGRKKSTFSLR
jgi:2-oxoglutarate ferredoxin oxidoreductase subunit alpha